MEIKAFNPILACFPTEFRGYKINTDFRVGLMMSRVLNSVDLDDNEKKATILELLYKDMPEDIDIAWQGVEWFLSLGYNKSTNTASNTNDSDIDGADASSFADDQSSDSGLDFDFDSSRIYTAFLRTYGVSLGDSPLHFFKFMFMLGDLANDTSHCKVMEIRAMPLTDMKGKQRASYLSLKRLYAVPTVVCDADKDRLAEIGIDDSDLDFYRQY